MATADRGTRAALAGLQALIEIADGSSSRDKTEIDELTKMAPDLIPAWVDDLHAWQVAHIYATGAKPTMKVGSKVGRNEPCPCGSGRKYKKCWGTNRIYAAMAQKERELISERTRVALAAAKARGAVLGGDRGYRPSAAPAAAAATAARVDKADRTVHRVRVEIARLRENGVTTLVDIARADGAGCADSPARLRVDAYNGGAGDWAAQVGAHGS